MFLIPTSKAQIVLDITAAAVGCGVQGKISIELKRVWRDRGMAATASGEIQWTAKT